MHSNQGEDLRDGSGTRFPIEGKIAISVIVLGVLAVVLKAAGLF